METTSSILPFLISGLVLGFSAGISPGPLLALVLQETLNHGAGAGIRVALAPFATDLPIMLGALLLVHRASEAELIMGGISLCGSVYIGYLGYESITMKGGPVNSSGDQSPSFRKGVLANFMSPHPYLFWATTGAPMILRGYAQSAVSALCFVTGFYLFLAGSKITIAVLTGRFRSLLNGKAFIYTNRLLGILLISLALILLRDSLRFFGLI
ncbi:MAG TPA: LysE family transporter [Spirochaetota bacterium]|nr:LysE family transporter [Spirochaetota bacterium]HPJ39083.1 LysE family transporter [Spirochaetota bacterium]HPQ52038.1 LysE family transporter [Spirochaetota bacterium]